MALLVWSELTAIDVIILLVLLVGIIDGFRKGVIRQAFSLGGLIAGLIVGSLFCKPMATFLLDSIKLSEKAAVVLSFILILIVVPLIFTFLGSLLCKLIRHTPLGFLDRVAGAFFGLVVYFLFTGLAIQLLEFTHLSDKILNKESGRQSQLYVPARDASAFCLRWSWSKVGELVEQKDDSKDNKCE